MAPYNNNHYMVYGIVLVGIFTSTYINIITIIAIWHRDNYRFI